MSVAYWEARYASGRDSGSGSRGAEAAYKAGLVNAIVEQMHLSSLLDLGCGDGQQAALLRVPGYVGYDPSPTAIAQCRSRLPDLRFTTEMPAEVFDATLSMDVIYHLTDDEAYQAYLAALFGHARRAVLVYGLNETAAGPELLHMRMRRWRPDVPPDWWLSRYERGSFYGFWLFLPVPAGP